MLPRLAQHRLSMFANVPASVTGRILRSIVFLGLGGALILACGCRPPAADDSGETQATIGFDPAPPGIGVTRVSIALMDEAGTPVRLGRLEVEGNMNHAGMKPVFARLEEAAPGRYAGTIEFTMGGDWFLLLDGRYADGRRFRKKVSVQVRAVELCVAELSPKAAAPTPTGAGQ